MQNSNVRGAYRGRGSAKRGRGRANQGQQGGRGGQNFGDATSQQMPPPLMATPPYGQMPPPFRPPPQQQMSPQQQMPRQQMPQPRNPDNRQGQPVNNREQQPAYTEWQQPVNTNCNMENGRNYRGRGRQQGTDNYQRQPANAEEKQENVGQGPRRQSDRGGYNRGRGRGGRRQEPIRQPRGNLKIFDDSASETSSVVSHNTWVDLEDIDNISEELEEAERRAATTFRGFRGRQCSFRGQRFRGGHGYNRLKRRAGYPVAWEHPSTEAADSDSESYETESMVGSIDDSMSVTSDVSESVQSEKIEIAGTEGIDTLSIRTMRNRIFRYKRKLAELRKNETPNVEEIKTLENVVAVIHDRVTLRLDEERQENKKNQKQSQDLSKKYKEDLKNVSCDESSSESSEPEIKMPTLTKPKKKKATAFSSKMGNISFKPGSKRINKMETIVNTEKGPKKDVSAKGKTDFDEMNDHSDKQYEPPKKIEKRNKSKGKASNGDVTVTSDDAQQLFSRLDDLCISTPGEVLEQLQRNPTRKPMVDEQNYSRNRKQKVSENYEEEKFDEKFDDKSEASKGSSTGCAEGKKRVRNRKNKVSDNESIDGEEYLNDKPNANIKAPSPDTVPGNTKAGKQSRKVNKGERNISTSRKQKVSENYEEEKFDKTFDDKSEASKGSSTGSAEGKKRVRNRQKKVSDNESIDGEEYLNDKPNANIKAPSPDTVPGNTKAGKQSRKVNKGEINISTSRKQKVSENYEEEKFDKKFDDKSEASKGSSTGRAEGKKRVRNRQKKVSDNESIDGEEYLNDKPNANIKAPSPDTVPGNTKAGKQSRKVNKGEINISTSRKQKVSENYEEEKFDEKFDDKSEASKGSSTGSAEGKKRVRNRKKKVSDNESIDGEEYLNDKPNANIKAPSPDTVPGNTKAGKQSRKVNKGEINISTSRKQKVSENYEEEKFDKKFDDKSEASKGSSTGSAEGKKRVRNSKKKVSDNESIDGEEYLNDKPNANIKVPSTDTVPGNRKAGKQSRKVNKGERNISTSPEGNDNVNNTSMPKSKKSEEKNRTESEGSNPDTKMPNVKSGPNEINVFKFLVKKLHSVGSLNTIVKLSEMFHDVDAVEWFRHNNRRFNLLERGDTSVTVIALVREATYCLSYITAKSCKESRCKHYHICKNLLCGNCKFGEKCKFSHNFLDESNMTISKRLGFDEVFTNEDILSIVSVRYPRVCDDWNESNSCRRKNCRNLHLCKGSVCGNCLKGDECVLEHSRNSDHNKPIITAYNLGSLNDNILFNKLIYSQKTEDGKRYHKESTSADETDDTQVPNTTSSMSEEGGNSKTDDNKGAIPKQSLHARPNRQKVTEPLSNDDAKLFTDNASQSFLCEQFVIGQCKNKACQLLHSNKLRLPYIWQVKMSDAWVNIEQSETAEMIFCEVTQPHYRIAMVDEIGMSQTITLYFEPDISARSSSGDELPARRLSTKSYAAPKVKVNSFVTHWLWYFRDDNGSWQLFDTDALQYTLESKYLYGQDTFLYSRDNYRFKYSMNFTNMKQLNLDTCRARKITRRPTFIAGGDVKSRKPPSKESLTSIPTSPAPLPPGWAPWDLAHPFELVELDPGHQDYTNVENSFYLTLLRHNEVIDCIYRVQSPVLWNKLKSHRKSMIAAAERAGRGSVIDERKLFHGTDSLDTVRGICINNFDPRMSGINATAYGDGAYFAKNSKYSHAYSGKNSSERFMFQAVVLVGDFIAGDPSYRRPPARPGAAHELYDSCVNHMGNPDIFIVFDRDQYYPEYLIQYHDQPQSLSPDPMRRVQPRPASRQSVAFSTSATPTGASSYSATSSYPATSSVSYAASPTNPVSYPATSPVSYPTSPTNRVSYPATSPVSYPTSPTNPVSYPATSPVSYPTSPTNPVSYPATSPVSYRGTGTSVSDDAYMNSPHEMVRKSIRTQRLAENTTSRVRYKAPKQEEKSCCIQ